MSRPPQPDSAPAHDTGSHSIKRLSALGQQLSGAYDPGAAVDRIADTLRTVLRPDGILIVLTDPDSNTPTVAHTFQYANPRADDPLAHAVISDGPRVLPHATPQRLSELGITVEYAVGSWVGAPIVAAGRCLGAVSVIAEQPSRYSERHLEFVCAASAQLGIALENARLLQLLSRGKREWEQTVDAIGQAFCVVDNKGLIRRANRAFSVIAHIPVTAVAGRPWLSVLPEHWADPVARALASAGSRTQHELKSGDRIFIVSAFLQDEPEGTAVLVFEDQTDKRHLQEQLIQSEKMSAIGELIAGVAHDLNNPLASVVGFADYLVEESKAPENLREPLEAIRQEAERAANIVRNLLNFARRQEGQRRSQHIGPILEATLLLVRNQLMASKVEAILEIDPDLPNVEVNGNQIQQVFVNLINNAAQAVKASDIGGNVVVHAAKWLDGVAVTVADDGPGIPDKIADRIFEPFFTTKAEGEGTGLGLSICHGIIQEHGGRIRYSPGSEGGAVFRVELPGGAPTGEPEEAPPAQVGKLKVLVVDDEPHILHYMRATLEAWGHAVAVSADGNEGFDQATSQPFDVIITDLRMGDLGGREMFEMLSRDRPDIARRVVFSTGDTLGGDALEFLESAGQPFLRKPFTLAELRTALAQAAGR